MKKMIALWLCLCMVLAPMHAQDYPDRIHENVRKTPYPQSGQGLYVNPAPLLIPLRLKQSDYVQFNLSQDKKFRNGILSKPVPWCLYNPHQALKSGTWYWRVRSVSKTGETTPWSETFRFEMTDDVPQFVTPPFEVFLSHIPKGHNRLYCFLDETVEEARKRMRSHPDYEPMIAESREALNMDYRTDTAPYRKITLMSQHCDYLHTAYVMFQREVYSNKMMENLRCLLSHEVDEKVIANDFNAGELAYLLACTYETCYDKLTPEERQQTETILLKVLDRYIPHIVNYDEVHVFDNHFWQFTFRHLLQATLVIYDKYPRLQEYLEYSYELWTSRAPAAGINRDGNWHNGSTYFSANAVSLCYVPTLFSYLTGTDFLQHPWYKNAGLATAYSWQPGSLSVGFGDGHEQTNPKPLRIRSAFADFLARTTGDPYATWYSAQNNRYLQEYETRLYRLASGKRRPDHAELPADAPKAVWFKDSGEMIANSHIGDTKQNLCLSFRSSPMGSGSHTHSNQNAFNLHYKGAAVYRSVGLYTSFLDAHNLLSYRNTRAHNTILIDGIGQPFTSRAYGDIVRMFNGDHISYALGDASHAYCGVSEYEMWERNFANQGLEQSRENGFGDTPLKKYRRHIFLLHPNKVVIYDELEADKAVEWDWLLHSPTRFDIDPATATLTTKNEELQFTAVARLICNGPCNLSQTDQYASAPRTDHAVRGEDFTPQWSLTARIASSKATRVLTLIEVRNTDQPGSPVRRDGQGVQWGDWMIEAELDAARPATLFIKDTQSGAAFHYGYDKRPLEGNEYTRQSAGSSILLDSYQGTWRIEEMSDRVTLPTGKVAR